VIECQCRSLSHKGSGIDIQSHNITRIHTMTPTDKLSIESVEESKIVSLTKGMYGSESNNNPIPYFNLRCGQMRWNDLVHNGGWYNKKGEKLGWGDISADDLIHLSNTLPEWEEFYILPEGASYYKFVEAIEKKNDPILTIDAPGMEYVNENCRWVISRGTIILEVDDYVNKTSMKTYRDMSYKQTSRELFLGMQKTISAIT